MTGSDYWDTDTAEQYDESSSFMFAPDVLELESRAEDWRGTPFTGDSESHVSVWRTPIT